jgi:hypothetical protein
VPSSSHSGLPSCRSIDGGSGKKRKRQGSNIGSDHFIARCRASDTSYLPQHRPSDEQDGRGGAHWSSSWTRREMPAIHVNAGMDSRVPKFRLTGADLSNEPQGQGSVSGLPWSVLRASGNDRVSRLRAITMRAVRSRISSFVAVDGRSRLPTDRELAGR